MPQGTTATHAGNGVYTATKHAMGSVGLSRWDSRCACAAAAAVASSLPLQPQM